jgi:uncharacterized lipoprotein YddW (UPF0748 family)
LLAVLALVTACAGDPEPAPTAPCWVWLNRWEWSTEADLRGAIAAAADAGFAAVLFQVRGNGTVFYRSDLEPWSERFGFRDPGFDPLGAAIDEARARGVQLHAWVNVMPGWHGEREPQSPAQLRNAHPDWFLADAAGRPEPLAKGRYLTLNPALPQVRAHLAAVCAEIAVRYPVDGIHLDYVRMVTADYAGGPFGVDPVTVELFRRETGKDQRDSAAFARWQAECVTRTVRAIRDRLAALPRRPMLTAAVIADPKVAFDKHRQDWGAWARARLLDALFPMNYTADPATFVRAAEAALTAADRTPLVMGIGAYQHGGPQQTLQQMEVAVRLGASAVAIYAHARVFGPQDASWRYALSGWNGGRRNAYPR